MGRNHRICCSLSFDGDDRRVEPLPLFQFLNRLIAMIDRIMDDRAGKLSFREPPDPSTSKSTATHDIRRYIRSAFASAVTLLILGAVFNLLVDAKGLYG